jgi:hypothetical protein
MPAAPGLRPSGIAEHTARCARKRAKRTTCLRLRAPIKRTRIGTKTRKMKGGASGMGRREGAVVILGRGGGSTAWQFVSGQDFVLRCHVPCKLHPSVHRWSFWKIQGSGKPFPRRSIYPTGLVLYSCQRHSFNRKPIELAASRIASDRGGTSEVCRQPLDSSLTTSAPHVAPHIDQTDSSAAELGLTDDDLHHAFTRKDHSPCYAERKPAGTLPAASPFGCSWLPCTI